MSGRLLLGGRKRAVIVAIVSLGQLAFGLSTSPPVSASFPGGSGLGAEKGFDMCRAPIADYMGTWWTYSPYWWYGAYLPTAAMLACAPNGAFTSSWLSTVHSQGWQLEFLWVGPQAPCTQYPIRFSSNTSTAYSQGKTEAINAMNELFNLGLTNSGLNTAVTYDLDAVGSCQAAINAFIGGWDYQLSLSPAQKYGVYGSVCGSNLQGLTGASPVPQFVWGSDPDGNTSTSDLWYDPANCGVTSGSWIYHQRIKQWATNQTEVWGGVTETVDDNCLNTWVNPSGDGTDQNCL